jgi:hypothetical protein
VVRTVRDGESVELPGGLVRARDVKGLETVAIEVHWIANPPEALNATKAGRRTSTKAGTKNTTARGSRELNGLVTAGEPKSTSGRKSRPTATAKRK